MLFSRCLSHRTIGWLERSLPASSDISHCATRRRLLPFYPRYPWGVAVASSPQRSSSTVAASRSQKSARSLVPIVIQREDRSERSFDIFSRLLRERIIFVTGEINDEDANIVVAQLLFLEAEASDVPISLYINSPGGSVTAGLAIYDTVQFIQCPVHTLCLGQASSMGSVLLAAGAPGHRHALPNASIMIHQPSGGAAGQASDIAIHAHEILRIRAKLVEIYQQHCGLPEESAEDGRTRFERALDRDYYLTAEDAKKFGIVDAVIATRKTTIPAESSALSSTRHGGEHRPVAPDNEDTPIGSEGKGSGLP